MRSLLTLSFFAIVASSQAQTLIFYSNFNGTGTNGQVANYSQLLTPSVNLVGGVYTVSGATQAGTITNPGNGNYGSFTGTTVNAQGGDVAGGSFVVVGTNSNGSNLTLQMNTTGWENIRVIDVIRRTGTGYNDIDIDFSADGGNTWNVVVANLDAPSSGFPAAPNVDQFLPASANNNSDVRLRFTFNGATTATGNMRMDNLTVYADAVPEPASMIALGAGLIALARRRRSK